MYGTYSYFNLFWPPLVEYSPENFNDFFLNIKEYKLIINYITVSSMICLVIKYYQVLRNFFWGVGSIFLHPLLGSRLNTILEYNLKA